MTRLLTIRSIPPPPSAPLFRTRTGRTRRGGERHPHCRAPGPRRRRGVVRHRPHPASGRPGHRHSGRGWPRRLKGLLARMGAVPFCQNRLSPDRCTVTLHDTDRPDERESIRSREKGLTGARLELRHRCPLFSGGRRVFSRHGTCSRAGPRRDRTCRLKRRPCVRRLPLTLSSLTGAETAPL